MKISTANRVTVRVGGILGRDNVSLELDAGEIYGLIRGVR